jgi:hypothetical protein
MEAKFLLESWAHLKLSGIFESAAGTRTSDPKSLLRFACFSNETTDDLV